METLFDNLGMEAYSIISTKIILYKLADNASHEIKLDFPSLNYATQSKGIYVVYCTSLKTGVQSYIKLIRF